MLHELKHHGPERVMQHLRWLKARWRVQAITDTLRYFGKRLPQMQYPSFQAQGWPIGSGMVECANKIVMQARLKGAGMHWDTATVNPMLALRCDLCNDRWSESWRHQQQWRQHHRHAQRQQQCEQRRERLIGNLKEQILRMLLLFPSSTFAPKPATLKGRTEGQKRWGRQPFSRNALSFTSAKK